MLLDSWAWIEYFKKSPYSKEIDALLERGDVYASVLSLSEIAFWLSRNGLEPKPYLDALKESAVVLSVTDDVAEEAGRRLAELRAMAPGMGMIDAIIYVQAASAGMPLVTGDPHFHGLPCVKIID